MAFNSYKKVMKIYLVKNWQSKIKNIWKIKSAKLVRKNQTFERIKRAFLISYFYIITSSSLIYKTSPKKSLKTY